MLKRLASWNPTRGIWETDVHDLLSVHSEPFSVTWPSSGMTRGGVAFELPTPVLRMVGSGSSSLPTPRASRGASGTETMYALGAERSDEGRPQGEVLLPTTTRHLPTPRASDGAHGNFPESRPENMDNLGTRIGRLLKTPTAQLAVNGGSQHPEMRKAGGHGPTLADEVEHLLPTPLTTTADGVQQLEVEVGGRQKRGQLLPTPTTQPETGNGHARDLRSETLLLPTVLVDYDLIRTGGRIDPQSSAGSDPLDV